MALFCCYRFGYNPAGATVFAFVGMLTAVAFTDMDTMEIPDELQLILLVIVLISCVTLPGMSLEQRLSGAVLVSVPLLLITLLIPDAFGGGDIKLMEVCGLMLGGKRILIAFFLAMLGGGLYAVYLMTSGRKKGRERFAFGPFLSFSVILAYFWGEQILNTYLHLCGL
jgi:leader peptidase (prepilin peptidase)/N-methyltransferase